ncbi:MAG: BamA/TamA family outer membrane protein [Candidatus Marinimicrobia bacterium]|jgi:outer membrane protein assembly factor BamA|nr:BamA/TamA family outer membrane protein [Candidatus Neomarinimicrobiota bacterium]MBT4360882.1 BamA/TamA family outer membrane protein [Candidatus Neomarinimicrobiota bacterium]MBT4715344.1 BamA/TamA family outer membrane protein [Candidatus Neomarinimicrobiota bacterium]MBT4947006.1 BamA/TamA family outer membrane protein [Candidatus Neomarinimicrobiota bacterium]MBT5268365.1 BamA/TamA family outer membrane protein [Candidatus Neomarinimicrobiota bacterium]
MSRKFLLVILIFSMAFAYGQEAKTGWGFGGVPAVAYNSDTGFLYGIVFEAYNFGDGSNNPDYDYTLKPTWTRTTKGSGENKLFFDSKYLLPYDIRVTAFAGYFTEQALPFYGFNGYEADYRPGFEESDSTDAYITRMFYRHERNTLRLSADFQKSVISDNLRLIAGIGYVDTQVDTVDESGLNEGKDEDLLPLNAPTLYDNYVDQGYIRADEANGGLTNFIKLGVVYDTRDNEPNPMSGIWTEALITSYPGFLGSDFSFTTLTATHRQYFTLIENDLSFAYRLGYQQNLGDVPFFMLPWYQSSYVTTEGMGGSKSLRGILKNRVVGNTIFMANMEARWKFYRTVIGGQNLYLALNGFTDFGQVLEPYEVENKTLPMETEEGLHLSFGGGLRIVLNENFIIAVDYGMASDEQDGNSGLYIGLGYLY